MCRCLGTGTWRFAKQLTIFFCYKGGVSVLFKRHLLVFFWKIQLFWWNHKKKKTYMQLGERRIFSKIEEVLNMLRLLYNITANTSKDKTVTLKNLVFVASRLESKTVHIYSIKNRKLCFTLLYVRPLYLTFDSCNQNRSK